jgi:hypothetical protein
VGRPAGWHGATSRHRWFNQRWRSFLRYWIALSNRSGSICFCASSPALAGLAVLRARPLFWVPLPFHFIGLIQDYALHRDSGNSSGGAQIKLVPPKVN